VGPSHMALPTAYQLQHMMWEMEMFIHFSITTYTGSQAGHQDPSLFAPDPATLNVSQWVATAKALGAPVAVLTAKHEAGYCIWPSKYSNYTIARSSTVSGRDLVREFVDECRSQGVTPGLYFTFGAHGDSIDVQVKQMEELTTNYGPIMYWWFDHHSNDTGHVVRKNIPGAVMLGPDSWVTGDESGAADYPLWYAVNTTDGTEHARPIGALGPQDEGGFPYGVQFKSWESSCSFFNGCHPWFCCGTVPSREQAMLLFDSTWGRGSNLILNLPPNRSGVIEESLVTAANNFAKDRAARYGTPIAAIAAAGDAPIVLHVPTGKGVTRLLLAEITLPTLGQLVGNYTVETFAADGSWAPVDLGPSECPAHAQRQCGGATIGVRHVDTFTPPLAPTVSKLRVTVTGNVCPTCPPPQISVKAFSTL